ncbi:MAG: ABC transporter ATP-binding protein [bacterium]|nr:ABC transporter ATP-binding protein [bacterium]
MPTDFLRIFRIVRTRPGRFIASQVAMFIAAVCAVLFSTLIAPLVNEGMVAGDPRAAIDIGIQMFVLAAIVGVCMAVAGTQAVYFSQAAGYVVRQRLYQRLQEYSFENYDNRNTGDLMVRLNSDVVNIQNATMYAIMLGSYGPFMLVTTLVLALITIPSLVPVLLAVVVLVLIVMAMLIPAIDRAYKLRQERLDDMSNTLQENLIGISVVKAFVREAYEVQKFRARAKALQAPAFDAAWRVAFLAPLLTGLSQFAIIVATWSGGRQVLTGGDMTVGEVSTFASYMSLIVAPLALLSIVVPLVLRGNVSAKRILEAYGVEPTIADPEEPVAIDPDAVEGRVAFENVTFAFRKADGTYDTPVLDDVSLTIEPGSRVGFLGATGSGKSALVNLIPRFYDVTGGTITIDGIDVRTFAVDDLRSIVGIALQEAVLFQGELRENLKFGAPDAEDETMFGAARAADAWGFVSRLPDSWDATVARRGYNFSGGQRQRLSITRALTPRPRIVILDDSTSALDASTEGRVQDAIPGFVGGATTIYVAQRISAVIDLDEIFLLDRGRIVARGTHEELLAGNELYEQIYESQLGSAVTIGIEEGEAP